MNTKERIGLIKLELIEEFIKIYREGTGKEINNRDINDKLEIVEFILDSQDILKKMGSKITLENDREFLEKFFETLIKYKKFND